MFRGGLLFLYKCVKTILQLEIVSVSKVIEPVNRGLSRGALTQEGMQDGIIMTTKRGFRGVEELDRVNGMGVIKDFFV